MQACLAIDALKTQRDEIERDPRARARNDRVPTAREPWFWGPRLRPPGRGKRRAGKRKYIRRASGFRR